MSSKAEGGSDNTKPTMPTLNDDEKKRKEQIRQLIDKVAIRLLAGVENGLFEQKKLKDGHKLSDIQKLVNEARDALEKNNLKDAEGKQEEALNNYFSAVNDAGLKWKFSGFYAGPIWIFLVGVLVGIFVFYIFGIDKQLVDPNSVYNLKISSVAVDATAWGIIGSVLRGLWWLRFNVARNNYRKGWRLHYISSPFIGGILGAIVYILILGGLVSVTNQAITPTNSVAIIPLAAFAGFNWEWAIKLFNKIQNIIDVGKDE